MSRSLSVGVLLFSCLLFSAFMTVTPMTAHLFSSQKRVSVNVYDVLNIRDHLSCSPWRSPGLANF